MSKQEEKILNRIEELSKKEEQNSLTHDEMDELDYLCSRWNYEYN